MNKCHRLHQPREDLAQKHICEHIFCLLCSKTLQDLTTVADIIMITRQTVLFCSLQPLQQVFTTQKSFNVDRPFSRFHNKARQTHTPKHLQNYHKINGYRSHHYDL